MAQIKRRNRNSIPGKRSYRTFHNRTPWKKYFFFALFLRLTSRCFDSTLQRVPSFEASGELKTDGQVIRIVKHTDDFVIPAMPNHREWLIKYLVGNSQPAHDTTTNTEWQLPEVVLIQFISPDDEHEVLETCREL